GECCLFMASRRFSLVLPIPFRERLTADVRTFTAFHNKDKNLLTPAATASMVSNPETKNPAHFRKQGWEKALFSSACSHGMRTNSCGQCVPFSRRALSANS